MLGYAFADCDRVGRLTRAEAVAHLRRCLASTDTKAVLRAVGALRRTGSKEAAVSVIPLLRHPDEKVRLAAAEFLEWAQDRRAVGPLCKGLDGIEKDGELGHAIGKQGALSQSWPG
jgi:HEAT repeat protein